MAVLPLLDVDHDHQSIGGDHSRVPMNAQRVADEAWKNQDVHAHTDDGRSRYDKYVAG